MRKLLSLAVVFLYLTLNSIAGQPDVKLHKECLYPTIMISTIDKTTYGTACIVKSEKVDSKYRNIFISCAHVIEDNKNYQIFFFEYEKWSRLSEVSSKPCKIYALNKDYDIAIGVFFSEEEMPIAEMDFDPEIYIGNDVFRIGCGLASEPRLDFGKITSIRHYLRTSIFTIPGDSGSPVFHKYKIIGIMRSIRMIRNLNTPAFKFSFATPLWKFEDWSKERDGAFDFLWDSNKKTPRMPFLELEMEQFRLRI